MGVPVDPGAHPGERREHDGGDAGQDTGQAVHVVAQVGEPEREAEQGEQHPGADQAEAAHQLGGPEPAVGLDGAGDRVGDVVVDGRRERLGERAQRQQVTVADLLGGQRQPAVEHRAVAADQVEAGGGAVGLALVGQAQHLGVDVRERDVLGQGDVDPAVRGDDGHPAVARRGGAHASTSLRSPMRAPTSILRRTWRSPLLTVPRHGGARCCCGTGPAGPRVGAALPYPFGSCPLPVRTGPWRAVRGRPLGSAPAQRYGGCAGWGVLSHRIPVRTVRNRVRADTEVIDRRRGVDDTWV